MSVRWDFQLNVAENRSEHDFRSTPNSIVSGFDVSKRKVDERGREVMRRRAGQEEVSSARQGCDSPEAALNSVTLKKQAYRLNRGDQNIEKDSAANRDWDLESCKRMSKRAKYFTAKASRVDDEIRYF